MGKRVQENGAKKEKANTKTDREEGPKSTQDFICCVMATVSGSVSTVVEAQKKIVQQVHEVSVHVSGLEAAVAAITQTLADGVGQSTEPTADVCTASCRLSNRFSGIVNSLAACLQDLVSMGEAMQPVLEASDDAAPALLLNFYGAFVKQMAMFFTEMNDGWTTCGNDFDQAKAAFYRELPSTSSSSLDKHGQLTSSNTLSQKGMSQSVLTASSIPARPFYQDSVANTGEASGLQQWVSGGVASQENTTKSSKNEGWQQSVRDGGDSGSSPALRDSVAAGKAASKPSRSKLSATLDQQSQGTAASNDVVGDGATHEPAYLVVVSSLEAALGPATLASRPSVFTNVDVFLFNDPTSTYYIALQRTGSLAYLVFETVVNVKEDAQADFLCDVLDTDCVEVEPFASTAGEVEVLNASDLSTLPPCAWSVGSSEDHTRQVFTMYALTSQSGHVGLSAFIQNSLNIDGSREEVLHIVTLEETAPQYAKVSCYVLSNSGASKKQAAVLSFTRRGFSSAGFSEVPETEVRSALSMVRQRPTPSIDMYHPVLRDATETFQPSVELASLDQPGPSGPGLSLGSVAKGAMWGGIEVLKAPLTVSRAVGGAVLDVTGVSEAMRNNTEGTFRKAFPDLAEESLVGDYNCTWMEGSSLKVGVLFITPGWVCFKCSVSSSQFSIEYDEIKNIQKSKSVKLFENALEITLHLGQTIFLTNFLQRDRAYALLMQYWLKK